LFLKGYIKHVAITWQCDGYELDLAPDAMYQAIKHSGVYVFGKR
jgi:hypothetical protein